MLQTVLGIGAAAFAVPPSTMAQRLVRAKCRIRDARIPFVVPVDLQARLPAVLEAIYGAYAVDWERSPDDAADARRPARRIDARFVPLDEQDPGRWDRGLIERGAHLLARAHGHSRSTTAHCASSTWR